MGAIKGLIKDTAVYGMSSIIGRFLNWCLVPLYTHKFAAGEYGLVTYIYSFVAVTLIILIYGMETGFFRFANHEDGTDPKRVYSTALISLASSSTIFFAIVLLFLEPISDAMSCRGHESFIWMMAMAVAIDAFTAMPFSYLRYQHRPVRFATVKLIGIALNIGLNLFFILMCPWLLKVAPASVEWFYNPAYGVGYIFLANFISSTATLLLLIPELRGFNWVFDKALWVRMVKYSWPLLVLGVAGVMNQTIDKILLPDLIADKATAMDALGIYGANYKIAIVMVMFIQAFRFAYEPFIFSQNKRRGDDKLTAYRDAMKYFVIFSMVIFLGVMFYIDILKYFIAPKYFVGLKVVPIIMIAEFFFGVFFNLSLWYKLTDQTHWGMWFSLLGLAVTVGLNVLLVPRMGYMGCAWAALGCYSTMMLTSYFVGRSRYPIDYQTGRLLLYFAVAMGLYGLSTWLKLENNVTKWGVNTILLAMYVIFAFCVEKNKHDETRQRQ